MPRFNINTDDLYGAHFTLSAQTTQIEQMTQFGDDILPRRGETFVRRLDRFIRITQLLLDHDDYVPTASARKLWLGIGLDLDEFEFMVEGSNVDDEEYEVLVDAMDAIDDAIDTLKIQFKRRVKGRHGKKTM
jgi:hypothetical protein